MRERANNPTHLNFLNFNQKLLLAYRNFYYKKIKKDKIENFHYVIEMEKC